MAGKGRRILNENRRLLVAVAMSVAVHVAVGVWPGKSRDPLAKQQHFIEIGIVEAADFKPDQAPVRNLAEPTSGRKQSPAQGDMSKSPAKKNVQHEDDKVLASSAPSKVIPSGSSTVVDRPVEKKTKVDHKPTKKRLQKVIAVDQVEETAEPNQSRQSSAAELSTARNATRPLPLSTGNPSPRYPRLALRRGWEGEVVLRVKVDATGCVARVRVHTSSGHDLLDDSAVEAVRAWRFYPARHGGQPVAAVVRVPVQFRLERS